MLSSRNAGATIPGFEGLSGHGRAAQMKHEADMKTALIILYVTLQMRCCMKLNGHCDEGVTLELSHIILLVLMN